MKRSMA